MTKRVLAGAPILIGSVLALAGCTASLQKPAIEAATANDGARAEAFEATLRVLDENPGYVDEFFLLARRDHAPTLERFIENTAREASDRELARRLAAHLVQHPASLEAIQVETFDAARERPEARAAMARAVMQRPDMTAQVVAEHPESLRVVSAPLVAAVLAEHEARVAFLATMQAVSPAVAGLLAKNPETLTVLMRDVLDQGGVDVVKKLVAEAVKPDAP